MRVYKTRAGRIIKRLGDRSILMNSKERLINNEERTSPAGHSNGFRGTVAPESIAESLSLVAGNSYRVVYYTQLGGGSIGNISSPSSP